MCGAAKFIKSRAVLTMSGAYQLVVRIVECFLGARAELCLNRSNCGLLTFEFYELIRIV